MNKISCIYLVKNEEEFIGKSIATILDWVEEVIIVNNQSSDGTMAIVNKIKDEHPNKVFVYEHDTDFDHSCEFNERNRVLPYARHPWVMILDADQLMSDGWRDAVSPFINLPTCDCVRVRYEHLVGSYEYIHTEFYEKHHNPSLHPDVPLWQSVLFRKTPHLKCRPACESDPRFKPFHHARFDESVRHGHMADCYAATVFHYGFAKRNMDYMAEYRIQRGDYGHDPAFKADLIRQLRESGNEFKFIGRVHRVDYGPEFVPAVMRDAFDKTYKLTIDENGFIQKRVRYETEKETQTQVERQEP